MAKLVSERSDSTRCSATIAKQFCRAGVGVKADVIKTHVITRRGQLVLVWSYSIGISTKIFAIASIDDIYHLYLAITIEIILLKVH